MEHGQNVSFEAAAYHSESRYGRGTLRGHLTGSLSSTCLKVSHMGRDTAILYYLFNGIKSRPVHIGELQKYNLKAT